MNIQKINSQLETLNTNGCRGISQLQKDINLLNLNYNLFISKLIKEIDILQDENYNYKQDIKHLLNHNEKLKRELKIKDNIINAKTKRILDNLRKHRISISQKN
jgi:hypothetical protein